MVVLTSRSAENHSIKDSPASSTSEVVFGMLPEGSTVFTKSTGVKIRKAIFLDENGSLVLWLGHSRGKCLTLWRKAVHGNDFIVESVMELKSDPNCIVAIDVEKYAVGLNCGDVIIISVANRSLKEIRRFKFVHGSGDSRCLALIDEFLYSGSSNGTIARIHLPTGESLNFESGFGGVMCMSSLAGGVLLATGHTSGQLLVWDLRNFNERPSGKRVVTPSKAKLDMVTTVTTHPSQANLLAFGTEKGHVGFCDVRDMESEILPTAFEVSTSAISEVKFHPQCSEHMVTCSVSGSVLHWDASNVKTSVFSSLNSRSSPWLSESLSTAIVLNTLRAPSPSSVSSVDITGRSVIIACEPMSIVQFEGLLFPVAGTNDF